jgi:hypothetical protein
VTECYNTAQFMGPLPGRRGALGTVAVTPGTLLVVDEASMMSTSDMADLVSHAEASRPMRISPGRMPNGWI